MNQQLIEELPQLLELRVSFFDPSFEAMIRMQSKFAEEGYEKLGGVQRYVWFSSAYDIYLTFSSSTDISLTMSETIMLKASWTHRLNESCKKCESYRSAAPHSLHALSFSFLSPCITRLYTRCVYCTVSRCSEAPRT